MSEVISYIQFEQTAEKFRQGYTHGIDHIMTLGGIKAVQEWHENVGRGDAKKNPEFFAGWLAAIMSLDHKKLF